MKITDGQSDKDVIDDYSEIHNLNLDDILNVFLMLGLGILFSSVTFVFEYWSNKRG